MTDKQQVKKLKAALARVVILRRLLREAEADLRSAVKHAQQPPTEGGERVAA
jgi:hypothetical protein